MDAPILPIVHLNGTSLDSLLDQRINFLDAMRQALDAFASMSPNGRDYYLEPGLFEKAIAQHRRRLDALLAVLNDVEVETEKLSMM